MSKTLVKPIRISASRLKTLTSCTMLFYYQEIQRLPSSSHWKTRVGSAVHSVFECIMHPRRRALFKQIIESATFNAYDHPSILRYIRWYIAREDIPLSSVEEISELLNVAFLGIRRHFINSKGEYAPPPRFVNEHRFQLKVGEATMSGFIDLLILWGDTSPESEGGGSVFIPSGAIVIDLKTQGQKFTRAELPSNGQAIIYQLCVYKEWGIVPAVEFILLRHGPTVRTPDKHIQRVEPPSLAALLGLEDYISSTYDRVNQFSLEDALSAPNPDIGFCTRVCGYYKPFPYWVVCSPSDPQGLTPLSSHLSLDLASKASYPIEGSTILERRHAGCMSRWVAPS